MTTRRLHVAAYDVRHPKRLRKALRVLKGYATGGQKSVFECFLTAGEAERLVAEVRQVIKEEEDAFLLVTIEPRSPIHVMGIAVQPDDPPFFYVG